MLCFYLTRILVINKPATLILFCSVLVRIREEVHPADGQYSRMVFGIIFTGIQVRYCETLSVCLFRFFYRADCPWAAISVDHTL